MRYCLLCGVPVSRRFHEPQLGEFRAIWIENTDFAHVKLSGVGLCSEFDDFVIGTVPKDASRHIRDETLSPDAQIDVALTMSNLESLISPELPIARGRVNVFWGFPFHASCWQLFTTGYTPDLTLLFEACLSMPIPRDPIMDWGHDYGGAAVLRKAFDIPTLESRFLRSQWIPGHFRAKPLEIPDLVRAVRHSPRMQNDVFQSHLVVDNARLGGDGFSRLPSELVQAITLLLPTRDLYALRLASPVFAMAKLTERFWRSRFQQGHEFAHVFETVSTAPESWGALYLSLWIWARENPQMRNRRRIWDLAERLRTTLDQMDGTCHGMPLETWFEPSDELCKDLSNVKWRTAARSISDPRKKYIYGVRALRARGLSFSHGGLRFKSISVSFVHTRGEAYVSGLSFVDTQGQSFHLGYVHPNQCVSIASPSSEAIRGWELALDPAGVRAIAIIASDGTVSEWAGEPGDVPRWHLAETDGISAIKAEFDALKLVSLSRNRAAEDPTWRNRCLWSPAVPPEGTLFNWTDNNDQPPKAFDFPITTLFFSGQITEIAIHTFDRYHIAGIEFIYDHGLSKQPLGHIGPFGNEHPAAHRFDFKEGHRIRIPIEQGEEITGLEVLEASGYLVGLRIRTNFGREVGTPRSSPEDEDIEWAAEWTAVQAAGSKVVGVFSTYGHLLWDMGLISVM